MAFDDVVRTGALSHSWHQLAFVTRLTAQYGRAAAGGVQVLTRIKITLNLPHVLNIFSSERVNSVRGPIFLTYCQGPAVQFYCRQTWQHGIGKKA